MEERVTVRFAIEAATSGNWDCFFKGRRLVDVLMSCKDVNVEFLIRAGVDPEEAVRLMGERNSHSIIGHRTHYVNRRPAEVIHKMAEQKKAEKPFKAVVILHKKDGTIRKSIKKGGHFYLVKEDTTSKK